MDLEIKTSRLKLKTLDESYADTVMDYFVRNRDFFEPWLPAYDESSFDMESQRERLRNEILHFDYKTGIKLWLFAIDDRKNFRILGDISFSNISSEPFLSCFLGYKICESENGRGYAGEAIKAGVDYLFNELKLHRVEANIIPRNEKSIKVVEKLGFVNEGLSKKYLKINGKWEDHYHYVLLNPEIE